MTLSIRNIRTLRGRTLTSRRVVSSSEDRQLHTIPVSCRYVSNECHNHHPLVTSWMWWVLKFSQDFFSSFWPCFFGCMPIWCFIRCSKRNRTSGQGNGASKKPFIMQYLHSLAAGVLIATCLLSLLPESLEAVRDAMSSNKIVGEEHQEFVEVAYNASADNASNLDNGGVDSEREEYPIAECLLALGFMFIYMVDSIIKSLNTSSSDHDDDADQFSRDSSGSLTPTSASPTGRSDQFRWTKPRFERSNYRRLPHTRDELSPQRENDDGDLVRDSRQENSPGSASVNIQELGPLPSVEIHSMPTEQRMQVPPKSLKLRSIALVTALCIHAFFDGVMLGLQTSQTAILSLLFALSLHKSFVAIGLSLTLLSTHENSKRMCWMLLYIFLFAIVAPLGLLLSAAFVHRSFGVQDEDKPGMVPGCLQAFAVGTFMYVTFTETTERHQKRALASEIISHIFLVVGFALMAGLRAAIGDA